MHANILYGDNVLVYAHIYIFPIKKSRFLEEEKHWNVNQEA